MTQKRDTSRRLTFAEVNAAAVTHIPRIVTRLLPGGRPEGAEYVVRNPRRADNKPGSFKINLKTGKWQDFATGDKGGDIISLVSFLDNINPPKALDAVARMVGMA